MADLKLVNVKKVYPWESASEKKKAHTELKSAVFIGFISLKSRK